MDGLQYWKFKQYSVSEVTLEVVKNLIERRTKEKRFEQLVLKWSLSLFVMLFFSLIYIYFYKLPAFGTMFLMNRNVIGYLSQDKLLLTLFIIGIFSIVQMIYYKKKHTKAENEYEELRIATIERGEELWEKPVPWKHRHEVFDWLKQEHDVNLYHK
ncbi:YpbF family protein [Bacillus sp. Marseille-Q3570]|uniref:YpbF family protein n=1 Tax=Bacillus sp. Marseille-Q3570 TaxID=2963522 RepID=UPI0021B8394F|nr:YpbF family protein [Bacillus sp. Marseille-Q3570]